MKVLILITIVTRSFGVPYPKPKYRIVQSPEQASLIIGERELRDQPSIEPNQLRDILYEINFDSLTIMEIEIPKIIFEKRINK